MIIISSILFTMEPTQLGLLSGLSPPIVPAIRLLFKRREKSKPKISFFIVLTLFIIIFRTNYIIISKLKKTHIKLLRNIEV